MLSRQALAPSLQCCPAVPKILLRGKSAFSWNAATEADTQKHDPEEVFAHGMRHHHICNTAYPIGHKQTLSPYRVARKQHQQEIKNTLQGAYGELKDII